MKRSLLFVLSLFLFTTLKAQESEYPFPNHLLKITLGPSVPLGDYADTDSDNDEAGLAMTGASFGVNYHFFPVEYIGIGADFRLYGHASDEDAIADGLEETAGGTWDVESTGWGVTIAMPNVIVQIPAGKVFPYLSIGAGYGSASSPEFELEGTNGSQTLKIEQSSASAGGLAARFGVGVNFQIGRVGIDLQGSYLTLNATEFEIEDENTGEETEFDQQISAFNIETGISILLGKME